MESGRGPSVFRPIPLDASVYLCIDLYVDLQREQELRMSCGQGKMRSFLGVVVSRSRPDQRLPFEEKMKKIGFWC
jgi:hypothetical protein